MIDKTVRNVLLMSVAAGALAACGADDIASPGEGVIVVPPPGGGDGGGGGGGGSGGTPTPGTPADTCPTGTANVGTIEVGGAGSGDERRICQISGIITDDLFIPNNAGTIYALSGKVEVGVDTGADGSTGDPAILTIEDGVTIFGATGADFLAVNRGSQLVVDGRADSPVVMTSRANVVGTSTDSSIGQWGGLVILGQAPAEGCTAAPCGNPVEGTAGSLYGGPDANDSSGRIEYLQVRYAGFEVDTNNELNGITLGGVGAGTIFNHVQVHNSSDDGIEWFGGRVSQKYLVLTGNDDDSLDADVGYRGGTQYAIVIQRADGGDKLAEIDSPGNQDLEPGTNWEISNFTWVTPQSDEYLNIRGAADFALYNGVIVSAGPCIDFDEDATVSSTGSARGDELGAPRIKSVVLDCTANPYIDDGDVSVADMVALFNGNNNNDMFTNSLTSTFINGANETGVTASDATELEAGSFFDIVDYVGAVRDANDTWWQGWTCGLPGEASCLAIPAAG
ncbi:MAG: hypothetical protein HKO13_05325 [Sphingomonas sp.]|nr:hypothetical protein [Sphingomonas sp.]